MSCPAGPCTIPLRLLLLLPASSGRCWHSRLRYPQLYSRVGFVHQFHVLSQDETRWLLEQRWNHLGMHIRVDDFTDQEALAAIVRITGGNFRVIHRLLMQVERILEINQVQTVIKDVVETARENLVLGQA